MNELKIMCPEAHIDELSDALDALDALSISVEDADAQTDAEQALFGEPDMPPPKGGWQRSRVTALFATEDKAAEAAELLKAQDFFEFCSNLGIFKLHDQDWVRLTQSQFEPVEITPTFWIVPTWHEPPEAAKQIIRLDPGLAFGTGTHPTTRMCLKWIARQTDSSKFKRVLDYGCGSGILAIGAAKFGALDIDAVDIDPSAVEASLLNATANNVTIRVGLTDTVSGQYETVLANILASPLKVLAPLLCSRVAKGGSLVLAGILERQADELKAAYAPYCQLEVANTEEGWILMTASF
ncbi:MAG: 50S ribosomal protein L11 methyltransferase [Polaromonas sp.]|jgi:ribosomal protein L11 methyltransferase|nr:50S ribosomal protein L11 methyltransferase [Polaromonas sp.]MBK9341314.1 50S ribosomal protein L11 methyltransferase [Rhodoferax sp.]MBK7025633.1 50S ribosomal protein L11 methyltransferase [Polaromonas sp.]MBP6089480.1 50S ribosomal protein L11 methyltransferase [Polaromonas sp.]MBP6156865.1 50S ribosomal protein L11 methyltransferase [Polaromonas sp.]